MAIQNGFAPLALLLGAVAAGILALRRSPRDFGAAARAAVVILLASAAAYCLFMSGLSWVHQNLASDRIYRYWLPGMVLAAIGIVTAATLPVVAALTERRREWLCFAAPLGVLAAACATYGLPSLAVVRHDINRTCGRYTAEIVAAECTHVAGDYWSVWLAVFHANLVRYEHDPAATPVWGLTYRSEPTRHLWAEPEAKDLCIAVPRGQEDVLQERGVFNLGEMTCASAATICVLRPRELFLTWPRGFLMLEGNNAENWRWCDSEGELHLNNLSDQSRLARIAFQCRTEYAQPYHLSIESPVLSEQLEVSSEPKSLSQWILIPPGRTVMRFRCDAPALAIPNDPRRFVFRLLNLELVPVEGETELAGGTRRILR